MLNRASAYLKQKDPREEVILKYAPLVKKIALHLKARLPASVQLDDLIQVGMIGLMEATQNYLGQQGATFETYASIRIKGSMLDEIRQNDWAPRSVHKNSRSISEAVSKLSHELGRQPYETEIAQYMKISLEDYRQMLLDSSSSQIVAIEDLGVTDDVITSSGDQADYKSPLVKFTKDEFAHHLVEAMKQLPEKDALILSLYYDEEMNLKEIGAVLNVSESRSSQLLSQAIARLRAILSDWLQN
ncbi:MAG: RNA polymerase sigma factor FliA [Succinivibrionaceae bacterium]|nr:RNA polymerase sigma factor FliA [Succinivibrionaceae bacterium]